MTTDQWVGVAAGGAAAVGFVAGLIVGGARLVRVYDWSTEWSVAAPREQVFALFNRPEEQDRWWPSMIVERTTESDNAKPRSVTYRVVQAPSVRRLAPPFHITATQTDVEPNRRIRAVVRGDLAGVLDTLLFDGPAGGTRVVFHWYVRVCNPLLNVAGYFASPLFQASHDHVMREGEAGLRAYFDHGRQERPNAAATEPSKAALDDQR